MVIAPARRRASSPLWPTATPRRRGQQARVDGAGHAHLTPEQAAGLGLEERAMVVPVDEQRSHQRGGQRHNQRDRNAQQRGLHAFRPLGSSAGGRNLNHAIAQKTLKRPTG